MFNKNKVAIHSHSRCCVDKLKQHTHTATVRLPCTQWETHTVSHWDTNEQSSRQRHTNKHETKTQCLFASAVLFVTQCYLTKKKAKHMLRDINTHTFWYNGTHVETFEHEAEDENPARWIQHRLYRNVRYDQIQHADVKVWQFRLNIKIYLNIYWGKYNLLYMYTNNSLLSTNRMGNHLSNDCPISKAPLNVADRCILFWATKAATCGSFVTQPESKEPWQRAWGSHF